MIRRARKTALIMAAHGSRQAPASNALIRSHARAIARLGRFDEVAVAFHQGAPAFAEVLDELAATDITVVPMMTSGGYYSEEVLPRELAKNRRFAEVSIRQTRPIGTHPMMGGLIMQRVADLMREHRLKPQQTELLVVGHGASNHSESRQATETLAENLRAMNHFAGVAEAFLEEQPTIAEAYSRLQSKYVIVIPFLIAPGQHATCDIPAQLGMDRADSRKLPLRQWIEDRLVIYDAAVGTYPNIVDLVMDLAGTSELASDSANGWKLNPNSPSGSGADLGDSGLITPARRTPMLRLGADTGLLGRWQANHVSQLLQARGVDVEVCPIAVATDHGPDGERSHGDPCASSTAALQRALAAHEIDVAVHSLRDLILTQHDDLQIAAVLPRGEVTESLVSTSNRRLHDLAAGSVVGVTNVSRAAQLRMLRGDLEVVIVQNSVQERISEVRHGALDAAVLATASLKRLSLLHESCETFSFEDLLPAAGQGAIAVQVSDCNQTACKSCSRLDDHLTRQAVTAEHRFVRAFENVPNWHALAYAVAGDHIDFRVRLVSSDGQQRCEAVLRGGDPCQIARQAVVRVTDQLAALQE